MVFLSPRERETLATICETLMPTLHGDGAATPVYRRSAQDADVINILEDTYERVATPQDRQELKLLLRAFEVGAFNGVMSGKWRSFSRLSQAEREELLANWAGSNIELRRKAFQGIKRLALFIGYANPQNMPTNPIWESLNYPGPPGGGHDEPRIVPTELNDDRTQYCDVLVIGSGAGGGVVAGELADAGYDVMVVEKGGYYSEKDFDGDEFKAHENFFEKGGALTTKDTAMVVLAGKMLGGGTTVNWNASFRTPDHVLREWANEFGIRDATSETWQRSIDAIWHRINVNCDESQPNRNNAILEEGMKKLGYHVDTIPRNVKGCEDCGFCNYGCSFGAKQGTLKTYLQDAHDKGTRIVVRANVKRVMHENGRATGAVMEVTDAAGCIHLVTVKAKIVVVSAGAIHTPAILKRSGLTNPHIGGNLHLHPVAAIFSEFEEPVRTWQGPPMSRISKQFSNIDGNGYGVAIEVAPAHPGLTSATLPWANARQHKTLIANMEHIANMLVITRDYHAGRVEIDKYGNPVLDYVLHPYDAHHMLVGVQAALKTHRAAGAKTIYSPHTVPMPFETAGKSDADFVRYLRQVEDRGFKPNNFAMFSAHQMSTARMAASPQQGAVKPTGESYEVDNLFVADASVLPTATGVNPMISIMGAAHYIAQHIKSALN